MRAIETNNLTKKYKDVTAVDELCLSVEQGELFALLGVNGAGKTTTIKMLSCLTTPTAGDAKLLGDSVVTAPMKVKEKINLSPQETAVAPNLTVSENLEFICGIYGQDAVLVKLQEKRPGRFPEDGRGGCPLPWHLSQNLRSFFWMSLHWDWTYWREGSCGI